MISDCQYDSFSASEILLKTPNCGKPSVEHGISDQHHLLFREDLPKIGRRGDTNLGFIGDWSLETECDSETNPMKQSAKTFGEFAVS
ncbi:MAG: hypothetical protein Tsb009_36110 [Planctomycetaceae bacterium]